MKLFKRRFISQFAWLMVGMVLLSACGGGATSRGNSSTPGSNTAQAPSKSSGPVQAASTEPILIGGLGPLTGSGAGLGAGIRDGGKLAVKLINAKGGVLGRPLELIMEDDGGDPTKGVAAARKLIERDGVFMLFGGGSSPSTIAEANVAQDAKVPFLVSTATAPQIATPARRYIFRTQVNAVVESLTLTKLAVERYSPNKVAILALANDYGKASGDGLIANLKSLGYNDEQIVLKESLPVGGTDFSSQVLKMKQAAPDVIFIIAYPGELVPLMRQVKQVGIKAPIILFSTALMRGSLEALGDNLTGVVTFYYSREPISEKAQHSGMAEFVREFKKEYGRYPDTIDMQGYQGMMVLAKALEKAGASDREKWVDAMESMGTLDLGLYLPLTFSKDDHEGPDGGTLLEFLPGRSVEGTLYGNVAVWAAKQ